MSDHDKIIDKYDRELARLPQLACFYSADRIPRLTRKLSGQARMNTRLSRNAPDLRLTLARPYRPGAFTGEIRNRTAAFRREANKIKIGDRVHITNNLDYIADLELLRGDRMFTKSAANWKQDNRRALREIKSGLVK